LRLLLGIAALALLAYLALRDRFPHTDPQPVAPTERVASADSGRNTTSSGGVVYIVPKVASVLAVPPEQMRDVVRAHRRVRPDRRIVLAVAALHNMLTGKPQRPVYARWTESGWAIEYGDDHAPVGVLPELASLADARALLANWANRVASNRPRAVAGKAPSLAAGVQRAIDSVSAPLAIETLALVDEEWKRSRDPALLPVAAEALAALGMFVDDRTDMADAVFARALAASVAARAFAANPPRRSDALLAYGLGYGSEAHDSANMLAADDPVRLFLDANDSALVSQAGRDGAHPLARYLALRRAADIGKAAWDSSRTEVSGWSGSSTARLETGLASRGFDFESELPRAYALSAFMELDRVAPSSRLSERVLGSARRRLFGSLDPGFGGSLGSPKEVATLERRLADARARFHGPFADSSVVDGYFRSAYFAAVATVAAFNLEKLSSVSGSTALAKRMQGEQPDGAGAEFARWVEHLADAKAGREAKSSLSIDVGSSRWLGQEQLALSFAGYARGALFNQHLDVLGVARAYRARLDSRPKHLWASAQLAYAQTWDMPDAERLYRRAAELDRDNRTAPWVARFVRDTALLRRTLEDAAAPVRRRSEAARLLGLDSLAPNAYVRGWFDRLIAARPDDWSIRDDYVDVLDQDRDAPAIERVAKEWLERSGDDARDFFDPVNARVALSRAYERQKRYADAWAAIEPAIPSYVGAAMMQGTRVLGRLGRLDSAYALASEHADRYPDSPASHAMIAEVLWRQRKYAEAARYLHDHARWLDGWTWRGRIAETFLEVFGEARDSAATEAMQQLAQARIPGWVLGQFGVGLRQRKRPDLAFAMHVRASEQTGAGGQRLPMQTYASLRDWRGDAEAIAWLRRFTPGVEGATAMILYQDDAFEELWSLDPPGRAYSAFTWLMRASAAATKPSVARRHRDELLAYYQRPLRDDYHVMGRHLMGLASEAELLAHATTAERRCEIAYYLGVRARAEGRAYDAADWFEAALETRQTREGELIWAAQQLSEWANQGKTLAVLEVRR
jgi:hypothetical protein